MAWLAIVPLSLLWLFCLTLPLSMAALSVNLFRGGSAGGGAAALLAALPAAWPVWRCSRAIGDYYTGRAQFRLTISRRDVIMALCLLAAAAFLAWNAVNYTSAQRRAPASLSR